MSKRSWIIIGALGTLFALVIGGLQWWKYATFGYNGLDLAIYRQAVWSLAHGHGFASSIHDPSYLGDHLEAWLIPLSWIYRLWDSALLLLWVQTLVIASSIVPLAKIVRRYLDERAAIVATALFIIHPLIFNIALYEFHGLVFALPLILWSVWFYLENRLRPWVLTLLALVIVREDMPLLVAGWAIMAAVDRRSWRWWVPPLLLAATWFPLAQAMIRQANHDGAYKYLAFYSWLGTSLRDMVSFPFRHPLVFLGHTITFNNLGTVVGMLVTVGFLPLFRPKRLWPLAILFAQLLLGNAQPGSFLKIHYTLPYLPFLFWAGIEAYRDIRAGILINRRLGAALSGTVASLLIVLGPLYSSLIVGPLAWPWTNAHREESTSPVILRQALQLIRPQDRILTTFAYLPALANRATLYSLNYLYLGRRQYSEIPYHLPSDIDLAIIDWQQLYEFQYLYRSTVFEESSGPGRIRQLLAEQGLGVLRRYGSVVVYGRGGQPDDTVTQINPVPTETLKNLGPVSLLGQPLVTTVSRQIHIESQWQANATRLDDLITIRYSLHQNGQAVWQWSQVLGQGPMPVSEWPQNTAWLTRDVLIPPDNIRGTASLSAEIVVPQGRYRLNRLQTFRPIIDNQKSFGTIDLGQTTL